MLILRDLIRLIFKELAKQMVAWYQLMRLACEVYFRKDRDA
jgi:hypothetical protein